MTFTKITFTKSRLIVVVETSTTFLTVVPGRSYNIWSGFTLRYKLRYVRLLHTPQRSLTKVAPASSQQSPIANQHQRFNFIVNLNPAVDEWHWQTLKKWANHRCSKEGNFDAVDKALLTKRTDLKWLAQPYQRLPIGRGLEVIDW